MSLILVATVKSGGHLTSRKIGEYEWLVASINLVLVFLANYDVRSRDGDMLKGSAGRR